jgi:2-dehydro-3-deoxyphosphogluconate aldolase/(4S)-4-hydroxy-2-oxoglutarate aldolase
MKAEIESSVRQGRIIAIIRGFAPDVCLRLAEAYAKGGIRLVEVTFNQKSPETWKDTAAAIKAIRERFGGRDALQRVRVGAGTVLTEEQLSMCEEAGGEYMITPNVNAALIRECVRRGLVAMPGALTPSEAVTAYDAGASFVKIFPAGSLGPGYVKAVMAPLSHIPFLAVGGVGPDNVADFIKAGCVGAGVGGNLTNKEWIAAGEWGKIEDVARRLVETAKDFGGKK